MQGYRSDEIVLSVAVLGDGTATIRGLGGGLEGTPGDPSTRVPLEAYRALARAVMTNLPSRADKRIMFALMQEYAGNLDGTTGVGASGGGGSASSPGQGAVVVHASGSPPNGARGGAGGVARSGPFPSLGAAMSAPASSLADGMARLVAHASRTSSPPALSPRPQAAPSASRRGRRLRLDP